MWCQNCNAQREDSSERCPVCGGELTAVLAGDQAKAVWTLNFGGGIVKSWPTDDTGAPVQAAFLAHRSSVDMDDKLLVNMLGAYGIPAFMNHPQNGCFGKVVLGMSGDGSDIFVPLSMLEEAKALMEDVEND